MSKKCYKVIIASAIKHHKKKNSNLIICVCYAKVSKKAIHNLFWVVCRIFILKWPENPPEVWESIGLKEIIIKAINIDNFITFQNGTLVKMFALTEENENIEEYKESKLYKLTKKNKYFKLVISAFTNFKNFLRSDTIIDYEYIWGYII